MQQDIKMLENYFSKLGLEPEVATLYTTLTANGPQTISELARHSKIERTRIYRLLDTLSKASIIEVKTEYKRTILKAAPLDNLQILLSKKEEDLRAMQSELRLVQETLRVREKLTDVTQMHSYKNIEGLKQMFWNQTRSKTEKLSILYENIQNRTNSAFFERWVRKCNEQGIKSRAIVGDHFLETQEEWYRRKDNERLERWQSRYVSDLVFPITHSTVVYDDCVSYYNWHEGDFSGVEIINQEIADGQREFFTMLWGKAEPITKQISQQLPE